MILSKQIARVTVGVIAAAVALVVNAGLPIPVAATVGTLTITADTVLSEDHVGNVVIGVDGVTLDCAGFTIQGPGSGTGITLSGKTAATVRNCTVADFGTGVFASGGGGHTFRDVGLPWSTTTRTGYGVRLDDSSGNTLERVRTSGRVNGIWVRLDSDGNMLNDVTVTDSGVGVRMEGDADANIFNLNDLSGNDYGLYAFPNTGQANVYTNNDFSDSSVWALTVYGDSAFTLSGNTYAGSANGINMGSFSGMALSDIDLTGVVAGTSLLISGVTDSTFTRVTAEGVTGISMTGGGGNLIEDSDLSRPVSLAGGTGISISNSSDNAVRGVTANYRSTGIVMGGTSSANTIEMVTALEASSYGINVGTGGGGSHTFRDLDLPWTGATRSGYGVRLDDSSGNTLERVRTSGRVNGIWVRLDSDGNMLNDVTVTDSGVGVRMEGDADANIFNLNDLSGNDYGLYAFPNTGQANVYTNNDFSDSSVWALTVYGDSAFTLSGNTYAGSANGINMGSFSGMALSDIDLTGVVAGTSLLISGVTDSTFTRVTAEGVTGISMTGGGGNLIEDSDLSRPVSLAGGTGISISNSSDNAVHGITASNRGTGLRFSGVNNRAECSTITANTLGVDVVSGAEGISINFNRIEESTQFGIRNSSLSVVNAENNYWGTPAGPVPPNGVSVNVDADPFASDPVDLANFCNIPPTADAGPDQPVEEGLTVTLDASNSTDLNDDPLTFAWELVSFTGPAVVLSSNTTATSTFDTTDDGVYAFQVTVDDDKGGIDTDEIVVTVGNVAPAVDAGPDASILIGEIHELASGFSDPGILDTHSATIDWGDGSPIEAGAVTQGAGFGSVAGTHQYSAPGVYIVTVCVADDDTGEGCDTQTVTVKRAFLVIDEDSIGKGNAPNFFSDTDVNDHIADIGVRGQLPFFAANVGSTVALHTGEVGDEGWFAPKTIPDSWNSAGSTTDGLRNYLDAGPGLGSPDANGDREALLDKIPGVTPLRAEGLALLEGRVVCGVVYKSDISINYDPIDGSLKGATLGIVAFRVLSVTQLTGFSSSSLPEVDILILDAEAVCGGPVELFLGAPEPTSSSEPFDVAP